MLRMKKVRSFSKFASVCPKYQHVSRQRGVSWDTSKYRWKQAPSGGRKTQFLTRLNTAPTSLRYLPKGFFGNPIDRQLDKPVGVSPRNRVRAISTAPCPSRKFYERSRSDMHVYTAGRSRRGERSKWTDVPNDIMLVNRPSRVRGKSTTEINSGDKFKMIENKKSKRNLRKWKSENEMSVHKCRSRIVDKPDKRLKEKKSKMKTNGFLEVIKERNKISKIKNTSQESKIQNKTKNDKKKVRVTKTEQRIKIREELNKKMEITSFASELIKMEGMVLEDGLMFKKKAVDEESKCSKSKRKTKRLIIDFQEWEQQENAENKRKQKKQTIVPETMAHEQEFFQYLKTKSTNESGLKGVSKGIQELGRRSMSEEEIFIENEPTKLELLEDNIDEMKYESPLIYINDENQRAYEIGESKINIAPRRSIIRNFSTSPTRRDDPENEQERKKNLKSIADKFKRLTPLRDDVKGSAFDEVWKLGKTKSTVDKGMKNVNPNDNGLSQLQTQGVEQEQEKPKPKIMSFSQYLTEFKKKENMTLSRRKNKEEQITSKFNFKEYFVKKPVDQSIKKTTTSEITVVKELHAQSDKKNENILGMNVTAPTKLNLKDSIFSLPKQNEMKHSNINVSQTDSNVPKSATGVDSANENLQLSSNKDTNSQDQCPLLRSTRFGSQTAQEGPIGLPAKSTWEWIREKMEKQFDLYKEQKGYTESVKVVPEKEKTEQVALKEYHPGYTELVSVDNEKEKMGQTALKKYEQKKTTTQEESSDVIPRKIFDDTSKALPFTINPDSYLEQERQKRVVHTGQVYRVHPACVASPYTKKYEELSPSSYANKQTRVELASISPTSPTHKSSFYKHHYEIAKYSKLYQPKDSPDLFNVKDFFDNQPKREDEPSSDQQQQRVIEESDPHLKAGANLKAEKMEPIVPQEEAVLAATNEVFIAPVEVKAEQVHEARERVQEVPEQKPVIPHEPTSQVNVEQNQSYLFPYVDILRSKMNSLKNREVIQNTMKKTSSMLQSGKEEATRRNTSITDMVKQFTTTFTKKQNK